MGTKISSVLAKHCMKSGFAMHYSQSNFCPDALDFIDNIDVTTAWIFAHGDSWSTAVTSSSSWYDQFLLLAIQSQIQILKVAQLSVKHSADSKRWCEVSLSITIDTKHLDLQRTNATAIFVVAIIMYIITIYAVYITRALW